MTSGGSSGPSNNAGTAARQVCLLCSRPSPVFFSYATENSLAQVCPACYHLSEVRRWLTDVEGVLSAETRTLAADILQTLYQVIRTALEETARRPQP